MENWREHARQLNPKREECSGSVHLRWAERHVMLLVGSGSQRLWHWRGVRTRVASCVLCCRIYSNGYIQNALATPRLLSGDTASFLSLCRRLSSRLLFVGSTLVTVHSSQVGDGSSRHLTGWGLHHVLVHNLGLGRRSVRRHSTLHESLQIARGGGRNLLQRLETPS